MPRWQASHGRPYMHATRGSKPGMNRPGRAQGPISRHAGRRPETGPTQGTVARPSRFLG
ncbi:Hypothetical Protein RSKD131_0099 [Cereibacter sphaeroides KD131]|nr:Hypothetical Protein RSKD131_0099 [Cereibacter sphaeroides KD131]